MEELIFVSTVTAIVSGTILIFICFFNEFKTTPKNKILKSIMRPSLWFTIPVAFLFVLSCFFLGVYYF